jgi:hypothetical protein
MYRVTPSPLRPRASPSRHAVFAFERIRHSRSGADGYGTLRLRFARGVNGPNRPGTAPAGQRGPFRGKFGRLSNSRHAMAAEVRRLGSRLLEQSPASTTWRRVTSRRESNRRTTGSSRRTGKPLQSAGESATALQKSRAAAETQSVRPTMCTCVRSIARTNCDTTPSSGWFTR